MSQLGLLAVHLRSMGEEKENTVRSAVEKIAEDSGVAVSFVDETSTQISVLNNNSICAALNPGKGFSPQCSRYCGRAFASANEARGPFGYECHAGLECVAVPLAGTTKPLAAIVGRTFLNTENYRAATKRAVAGDWAGYPPEQFFDNILLAASKDAIDKAASRVAVAVAEASNKTPDPQPEVPQKSVEEKPPEVVPEKFQNEVVTQPIDADAEKRIAESRTWRSFFGSLLKSDQRDAVDAILSFVARHFGLKLLIWLDRRGDRLENTAAFAQMKDRKVKLSISPDDRRLLEALKNDLPLELSERRDEEVDASRAMNLFPVAVDGKIIAGMAVLDQLDDEKKHSIARFCHSIAPQLEILRLRDQVESRDALSNAVRAVATSLKGIDDDDLWLSLTQTAAEMLRAERASLLLYDGPSDMLQIKALIGSRGTIDPSKEPGTRVSKIVFGRNEPAVVTDVTKTGLSASPVERKYRTNSFLSCPITLSGRHLGVMNFTDRACGKAFDRASLELFQAIEPQLALAIDRALLKERAGQFEQLSVTDALTGLLNRRYIEERLMEEVKRSNRHGFPMSFMMLDVDHFKSYNDEFGHPAGDEALKEVGHVIRETLRAADVAARFGGEEFSILLPQTNAEEAVMIAERIRHNVEQTQFAHRQVTITIGVASCSAELCSSPNIISAADKALYEAKRGGRNRVKVFDDGSNGK